jgi:hypothetical protein
MTRDDAEKLLDCYWGPRARRSEEAHYYVATRFSAFNRILSYTVVVLGVVTGSGLFATLSKQNEKLQLWLAIASLVAAAIVGYQRSAQFASRSVDHQRSGADWGVIVNETEELRKQVKSRDPIDAEFDSLRKEMDTVTKTSPQIPQRYFTKFKIGETYMYGDDKHLCPDEP